MKEGSISTFGCLSEVNACGQSLPHVAREPLSWLEDGDCLTIEGCFKTEDGSLAGFGPLEGLVLPPSEWPTHERS